jgi:uncharacterized LabA/DUF88 family protein
MNKRKTIVYIDGFNLYYGIRGHGWRHLLWLDLVAFSRRLLVADQELVIVKYFTSRIRNNPEKQKRQNTYLEALETLRGLKIYYGNFTVDEWGCKECGTIQTIEHEKQTDVNMAVNLLADAHSEMIDDAVLVTADSDQVPTIEQLKSSHPWKNILVVFPPGRHSDELIKVAHKTLHLSSQEKLAKSQLPDQIKKKDGFVLTRPVEWVPINKASK